MYVGNGSPVDGAIVWQSVALTTISRSTTSTSARQSTVNPVPVPETYALLMAGLAALAYARRRRR
jgi:hypothetical protein